MSQDDAFNAAKTAMALYVAYLNAVAREIGMDRALALHTEMYENIGASQGQVLKEQSGLDEFDAESAWSLVKTTPVSLGVSFDVLEDNPLRVLVKCGRCSVFEAGRMMGLDTEALQTFCRSGPNRFMDAATKQLNPNLSFRLLKFRFPPDDFCFEEIVLEK
jgi:hypothetical protein